MPVFQPYDLVWCPEAIHFPDPCILLVLLLVKAYCWSACRYYLVLPKTRAQDNPPPNVSPDHSCLLSHLVPHSRPVSVAPSFQTMFSGTRNNSTALYLQCLMTLEVGVLFLKLFHNFRGDMIDALFFELSLLHILNFLCVPMDENHNRYAPLSFCHVWHWSVGESTFSDVFRNIAAKPHSAGMSINVKLLLFDCGEHNGAHLRCITSLFDLPPNVLNTQKPNQHRPLLRCEFIPPSCWISCNNAVHFHLPVFTLHKKTFVLWHGHWHWRCHLWSHIYLRCCHPLCFRPPVNFPVKS